MGVYSQEYGYFFNSQNHDRLYNAESFETWLRPFFVSGVFAGCLQVLAQSDPDMTVKVTSGYANLDGKPAYWPDENTLQIATASGVYDRIDTIVLRRDNTNRHISLDVVTGVASIDPQPTAPQRTSDIFELVLAEVLVGVGVTEITQSKISDKRPDTSVCGYVMCTIDTPDFSELYAQFEAQAEEYFGEQAAEFLTWFDHMKDQLDEDAAGHLQLEIDDINESIGDVPAGTDLQTQVKTLQDGLAIIVDGDTCSVAVPAGGYAYVKNNMHGLSEGLYKNTSGGAFPVSGGSATSAIFTAVPAGLGGEVTSLNSKLEAEISLPSGYSASGNNKVYKVGKVVHLSVALTIPAWTTKRLSINGLIPSGFTPSIETNFTGIDNTNDIAVSCLMETDGDLSVFRSHTASCISLRLGVTYLT